MSVAKVVLNGETLIDTTQKTVTADKMVSPYTALDKSGTGITGNITTKTAADLTASLSTVTVPAGFYSSQLTKNVASAAAFAPAITLASSTGVITGTNTFTSAYYAASTKTSTVNLSTQAAKTVTPTEEVQRAVSSYYWTTGHISVAAISSTYVGTGIARKSANDLTANLSTVTVPAGYYSSQVTKNVTSAAAFAPAITLASSTGVITGTNTFTSAYYAASTKTSTFNLTTQAAQTINTSTADQTIASYRWLTGTQTIKSVTTSNLTAANIAEGVVVKVGDANNASRITQITGTHSGATSYTATISGSGNSSYCYVTYNSTKYYTNGNTFTYKAGDTLTIHCMGNNVTINGDSVTLSNYNYTYTLPVGDITINLSYTSYMDNNIKVWGLVQPTGTYNITAAGTHNVYKYSAASVTSGEAFAPAFTFNSATGVITGTNTFTAGYYTASTKTSTYSLNTVGTATFTPLPVISQMVVQSGVFTTGPIYVDSIPSQYIVPYGTLSISSNGIYDVTSYESANVNVYTVPNLSYGIATASSTSYVLYPDLPSTSLAAISYNTALLYVGASSRSYVGTGLYSMNNLTSGSTYKIIGYADYYSGSTTNSAYTGPYPIYFYGNFNYNATALQPLSFSMSSNTPVDNGITYFGVSANRVSVSYVFRQSQFLSNINIKILSQSSTPYDGFCAVEVPTADSLYPYYGIYKALATEGLVYSSGTTNVTFGYKYTAQEISDWVDSFSLIREGQFEGENFGGSFCFSNVTEISRYGFGWAYVNGQTGGTSATFSFPMCTSLATAAFAYNNNVVEISCDKVPIILPQAFTQTKLERAFFPVCSEIRSQAFYRCLQLSEISFPQCTSIGASAFYSCYKLSNVNFSQCTDIGSYAFAYCSILTTISFPLVTTISGYAFLNCSSLASIDFPRCTELGYYAFQQCSNLTNIKFSLLELVKSYTFVSTGIQTISSQNFPNLKSIQGNAFASCSSLSQVDLPTCVSISNNAFLSCTNLQVVKLSAITTISSYAFQSCTKLISLYLSNVSSVPTLGTLAFGSTPLSNYSTVAGQWGKIYVPSSLYTNFITATYWSAMSSRLVSV